ncbi:cytochrome P450 4V2 [Hydra vulgaris]|uniref:Cytochrome P450 4V2 n=1 Tax=Hydra vulgaris TaxID=6087 RepID=A0ABM4BD12_HYDVU
MICASYLILVGLFIFFVSKILWKYWRNSYGLETIATPPNIPLFGTSLYLQRDARKFFFQLCEFTKKYGTVFCIWLGPKPMILSSSVKFSEAVLSSQKVITKGFSYDFLHDWLKTGLLTSTGSKWKTRRRLLTPSFHFSILNNFIKIFEEQASILVDKLAVAADNKEVVDVQVPIGLATLDIICETSMGVKVNAQSHPDSEYVKAITVLNEEFIMRIKYPWLWFDAIYKLLPCGKRFYKALDVAHKLSFDVINERMQMKIQESYCETASDGKKFFLDLLLDIYRKGEIDTEGIQEEVDTFMFEGHDTTSAALGWTLWLLGKNPDVQRKLHKEIDEIELNGGSLYDKVRQSKYLENILKESLRMHPPVPLYGRTVEEDMTIDGQFIPKGAQIVLLVLMLHSNPDYWESPNEFIPERFEADSYEKRNPYSYVPFSAGPRNCIGQKFAMIEEKILLYSIMKNFYLKSMQDENEVFGAVDVIHKSINGINIMFTRR